ncbi:MAG: tetratricopeptide repeat protein, partial [Planctomycetes bacterium]|nr:tetratricopeptide repeat protein [Planctomycetota bacterium]
SLQLFLAVTLWRALLADRPRAPLVGLLAGLNALANPPFLLAVLALPLWMGLKQGGRPAGLCLGTALLCIAPATWANHQVTGELIPISAQAGITFAHGNSPNADGLYTPIPGISPERRKQNLDALRMVEETTGSASWVGTSKHFMRQGFSWCVEHPLDALLNVGRKVSYFFTESSYGDVYQPRLEREQGFMTPPAPVGYGSWFLLPGLIAGYFLWRRKALGMSELIVIGIPLVTVALFFYSPRYRMAALPVLTVLTTWLLFARHAKNGSPALMGWLTPGLLLPIFVQTDISAFRPAFLTKLGSVWEQQGQWAKAAEAYRAGIQAGDAQAGPSLGHVLRRLGREAEGLRVLQQAVQQHPESAYAHRSLAVTFAENGRLEEAEPAFRKAIALEPNDFESLSGLGNLCFQSERLDEAEAFYRQSIAAHAGFPSAWFNLATVFEERGKDAEAIRHYQHALSLNPQLMPARLAAAALLATSLDESVRQGEHALFLMSVLPNNLHDDPALYELRAAALAAAGMFDQAAENQLHAMNLYGNADRGEERRTASRWLKRYQAEKVRTRDN